jgi:hypothetical protein
LRIIHSKGFNEQECEKFREVIYGNILTAIRTLIKETRKRDYEFKNPRNNERAEKIMSIPEQQVIMNALGVMNPELGQEIAELWNDTTIRDVYTRKHEFQLGDSTDYFMDNLARITNSEYTVTPQDALRSRVKTVGIVETDFTIENTKFKVVDVGGM